MAGRKFFYGWVVVLVLMGMFAMSSGSRYTFGVVFKTLTEQFGWDRGALSAVVSLSLILVSALQIVSGWLADRFGPRLTLIVGFAVSAAVLLGMSLVTELWQVYLIYGVFGAVGFALVSPVASTALVSRWFHSRARGTALSLSTSGVAIGQLAITPFAAWLLVNSGWQTSYLVLAVVMGLVMLPLALLLLKDAPAESSHERDEESISAQRPAVSSRGHGGDEGESPSAPAARSEKTTLRQAIRSATWWELLLGVFSCGFTMSFASVHFIAYASDMGMDNSMAADALGLSGLFSIIGAIIMGKWSDRVGRRVPLGVTYTLRSLSFIILLFANNDLTLFLFAVILGLSWTSTTPLSAAVTAETWGRHSAGFLFGVVYTFMTVGSSVGSFLGGLNYDLMHNYTAIIIANSLVAGLGALASFAIREVPQSAAPPSSVGAFPLPSAAGR
jgi:MFS family permease